WDTLTHPGFVVNDTLTMEFHIAIISSKGGESIPDPGIFDAPNRQSNVILNIGGKKSHLSKELLAIHSSFFDTLFFGDFA
ncbi:hypothetical protein PMAYCL1PPCAC_14600, partial [Pristionchus mayeri]